MSAGIVRARPWLPDACGGSQGQVAQPADQPGAAADGGGGDAVSSDEADIDAWKDAAKAWGIDVETSFDDIVEWLGSPLSIEAFLNGDPAATETVLTALEAWDHCSIELASFPETPTGFEKVQAKMEEACSHFDRANDYFMTAVDDPDYADSIGEVADGAGQVRLGGRAMTDVLTLLEQAVADSDL